MSRFQNGNDSAITDATFEASSHGERSARGGF
jgi:hypothetical protein